MKITRFEMQVDGESFDLLATSTKIVDVYEFASASILVHTERPCTPVIQSGDHTLALTEIDTDTGYAYEVKKWRCFRNFVGITHLELSDSEDTEAPQIVSPPLNVLASNDTYSRALSFVRFIVESEFSSLCFSVTKTASLVNDTNNILAEKLDAGLRFVEFLNSEWGRFHHDPCIKKSLKTKVAQYNRSIPVDDRTIAYLSSHPDALQKSDAHQGDLRYQGQYYSINQVVQNSHDISKDVTENRVMMYFLQNFYKFLVALDSQAKGTQGRAPVSINGLDYRSIDQVMADSRVFANIQAGKIEHAYTLTKLAMARINREFGCSVQGTHALMPVPSQQVLSKQHYIGAYRLMNVYYKLGEPPEQYSKELYGLRNMSKLYEFITLITILKALSELGYNVSESRYVGNDRGDIKQPIGQPCNMFRLESACGEEITLLYDMKAITLDDLDTASEGQLVDMQHSTSKRCWRPDYQILMRNGKGEMECHILDAKYSSVDKVMSYFMNICSNKYALLSRVYRKTDNRPSLVMADSVTIIYSGEQREYKSLFKQPTNDSHLALIEQSKPALGYVGVTENDVGSMKRTLSKLLLI